MFIAGNSAHWRNKADNCITIWRDVEANDARVEVHIQKIRFREVGTPGLVELCYLPRCGRYGELDPVDAAVGDDDNCRRS
jgi:twinkle protein